MFLAHTQPQRIRTALAAFALAFTSACTPTHTVQSTWHDSNLRGVGFDKVLIAGMTADGDRRMSFEQSLAGYLRQRATQAWASIDHMSQEEPVTLESLQAVGQPLGATAIAVTQVRRLDVRTVDVDAYTDVLPQRQSGSVFRYDYIEKEREAYRTAEYSTELLTEVYRLADGEHIYSLLSTASGQETLDDVVVALADVIAKRLRSDGVVR